MNAKVAGVWHLGMEAHGVLVQCRENDVENHDQGKKQVNKIMKE